MTDPELEPLSEDLRELLDAAREAPAPPVEVRERLLSRLSATIAALPPEPPPSDGGGSPGSEPTGPPGQAGALPGASTAASTTGVTATGSAAAGMFAGKLPLVVTTFVVGGMTGAGIHAVVVERRMDARPPVTSPAPAAPIPIPEPAEPVPPPPPRAVPRAPARPPELGRDVTLGRERTLLEAARTAILRQEHASALDALVRHEKQFPKGQLVEEREVLYVQALAGAGRHDDARERGLGFQTAFPNSILLPAVNALLSSLPPK